MDEIIKLALEFGAAESHEQRQTAADALYDLMAENLNLELIGTLEEVVVFGVVRDYYINRTLASAADPGELPAEWRAYDGDVRATEVDLLAAVVGLVRARAGLER